MVGRRYKLLWRIGIFRLSTSRRGAASVAAGETSAATLSAEAQAASEAENDRENDERADDDTDNCWPSENCQLR